MVPLATDRRRVLGGSGTRTRIRSYARHASDEKKRAAEGAGVLWAVKAKAKPGRELTKRQRARNRRFGKVRAKVEHVFRVVKCQFDYRKVRYRGIEKNGAQLFALQQREAGPPLRNESERSLFCRLAWRISSGRSWTIAAAREVALSV